MRIPGARGICNGDVVGSSQTVAERGALSAAVAVYECDALNALCVGGYTRGLVHAVVPGVVNLEVSGCRPRRRRRPLRRTRRDCACVPVLYACIAGELGETKGFQGQPMRVGEEGGACHVRHGLVGGRDFSGISASGVYRWRLRERMRGVFRGLMREVRLGSAPSGRAHWGLGAVEPDISTSTILQSDRPCWEAAAQDVGYGAEEEVLAGGAGYARARQNGRRRCAHRMPESCQSSSICARCRSLSREATDPRGSPFRPVLNGSSSSSGNST